MDPTACPRVWGSDPPSLCPARPGAPAAAGLVLPPPTPPVCSRLWWAWALRVPGPGCSPRGPAREREPVPASCCGAEGPGLALSWAAPLLPKWPLRQAVPGQRSRHPPSAGPTSGPVYAGGSRALLREPRVGDPAPTSRSLVIRTWSMYVRPHSWGSGVADPRLQGNPGVWRPDGVESPSVSWERGLGPCSGGVRPLSVGAEADGSPQPTGVCVVVSCDSETSRAVLRERATPGPGLIPGLGRSPGGGRGSPLRSSCLENPMDRGA